jgi:hypothetical protein
MQNKKLINEKVDNLAKSINSLLIHKLETLGVSTERNEALFIDLVILAKIFRDILAREYNADPRPCPEIELARARVYNQLNGDVAGKELVNLKIRKEN